MISKAVKMKICFMSILLLFFISNEALATGQIKAGFSPGGTAESLVLSVISKANKSIHIAAYSFTSKPIALALEKAHQRGINILVVADKKANQSRYTAITYLANHGISVKVNDKYAIMHNKFMVIDNHLVQTGSFNYTAAANKRNAENVIVIEGNENLTKQYQTEFYRLWNESDTYAAKY